MLYKMPLLCNSSCFTVSSSLCINKFCTRYTSVPIQLLINTHNNLFEILYLELLHGFNFYWYLCGSHFTPFSQHFSYLLEIDLESLGVAKAGQMVEVRWREGNIYSGECSNILFCKISKIGMIMINTYWWSSRYLYTCVEVSILKYLDFKTN